MSLGLSGLRIYMLNHTHIHIYISLFSANSNLLTNTSYQRQTLTLQYSVDKTNYIKPLLYNGSKPQPQHLLWSAWWRNQMETFSALLALCAGNSPVPVNSPHKGQWRGALMFTLICARVNGWVNDREAGNLRRYRAHYDVIVMKTNHIKPLMYNGSKPQPLHL